MIRFLINMGIFFGAAAIALLVVAAILDDVEIDATSFIVSAAIFAVLMAVLQPFIASVARRNAPALLGGIGFITALVALLITDLVSDGLNISGFVTWILAAFIVWVATMLASLILPFILVKAGVEHARNDMR